MGQVHYLATENASAEIDDIVSLIISNTTALKREVRQESDTYGVRTTIRIVSASHNTAIEATLDLVPSCNMWKIAALAGATGGALLAGVASGGAFIAQAGAVANAAQALGVAITSSEALAPALLAMQGSSQVFLSLLRTFIMVQGGAINTMSTAMMIE